LFIYTAVRIFDNINFRRQINIFIWRMEIYRI
jgi:hypothetical protein